VTTISSGAGTTTLTLAAASTNAASGVTIEHDDSAEVNAATAAAAANTSGFFGGAGIVNLPNGTYRVEGLTFPLTTPHSNASMLIQLSGEILTRTPLTVPFGNYTFRGLSGAQTFANSSAGPTAVISGAGLAPVWHLHGLGTVSDVFEHIATVNCSASCYYLEQDSTGGPTNITWNNVVATGSNLPSSSPLEINQVAFGYQINGGVFTTGGNSQVAAISFINNGQIGIKAANFQGSGVLLSCSNASTCGALTLDFAGSTNAIEAANGPLLTVVTNDSSFNEDVTLNNPVEADSVTGQDHAVVKVTGTSGHGLTQLLITGADPTGGPALEGNATGMITCGLGSSGCSGIQPFGGLTGLAIDSGGKVYNMSSSAASGGLIIVPVLVSALPTPIATGNTANVGMIKAVSDSTAIATEGQTCVGGSTNPALAFNTGSGWKCF
jgi:hypothetical protein